MGYHIKYEELSRVRESLLSQLDSWLEQIESLKGSLRLAADMPEMKGAAGDSVRNYLKEVHLSLVEMIQHTIQVYRDNLVLYTSWYYSIETDMMAEFRQESIENQMELLNSGRFTYDETMEELSGILSEVSNYMSIEPVSRLPVTSRYANTYIHLDNLNNALGQYEEAHKNADLTLTEEMIQNITAIIHGHQSLSNDTISTYQAGSISDLPGFQYASLLDGLQKNYLDQVSGTVEECETVYVGRKEAWEEEIRQRKEQAMISMIAAVGTLIIGGIVIVCTFGMATPLVVGTTALTLSSVVSVSAGLALGGATFLYGESNFCESYNSYQYGLKGDARTVAENPIRDTCFAGDPELYYTVGNVCTMAASMMIPVGGSMTAAVNAGTSPVRAGLTELGMLGYSSVMASETADIVTDMTDSELAGMVAGTIVGMESYGGLKTLDQSVNISGLYSPKVPQTRSMKEIAGSSPDLLGNTNRENNTQSKIGYEYLDEQLGSLKGKVKINQYQSAESVNDWWEIRGYKSPYKEKTVVQNVTLTEDTKFVRVYDGVNSNLEGGWVMRAEDIKGLTPKEIQAKFALEYEPKFIGEVELKAGDTIRLGEVGPNFGFDGGGIQIDLQQQWIGDFTELGTIENWR